MKTTDKLECIFCENCGERIGWTLDASEIHVKLFCDDCHKEHYD